MGVEGVLWRNSDLERRQDSVMVFGVLSDPRVAVVDIGRHDILVHNLRHHHEPLGQEVSLKCTKTNLNHNQTFQHTQQQLESQSNI
jgi:hypothetical protein